MGTIGHKNVTQKERTNEHMERTGCKITHIKWKHLRNNKKKYFCKNCLILASRSDETQNMQIDVISPMCTKNVCTNIL